MSFFMFSVVNTIMYSFLGYCDVKQHIQELPHLLLNTTFHKFNFNPDSFLPTL